jgi:Na+-driven multidrug efflux pump
MGHEGAALGTGLAETATFFLLCRPFLSGRAKIRLYWRNRDIAEVAKAAVNGFPEFFNEFSLGVIMFVFNWIIMKSLGQAGIAAYSIINYMLLTGLIISYGVSEALQSIVCQNIGALKFKRIKTFLIISTVSVFAVGLIISLVLALNPNAISTLFMQSGSLKTIEMTNRYISIIWPIFIVNGVNVVLIAYLTALNRCFDSTIIILAKNLLLPALFLFIVHMVMDHDAILIVLPLAELATLFLGFFLLYKNRLGTVTNRKPVPIGSLFNPTAA